MPTRFPVPVISLCTATVSLGLALGVALTSTTEERSPDDRRSGPGTAGPSPTAAVGGGDPPMEYRLDVTASSVEATEEPEPPVRSTRTGGSQIRSPAPVPRPSPAPRGTTSAPETSAPLLLPSAQNAITPAPLPAPPPLTTSQEPSQAATTSGPPSPSTSVRPR